MKHILTFQLVLILFLLSSTPAAAQSQDIVRIENFIQSIIQILVTLASVTATAFIVWGGFRYITSSGHPEQLEGAKRTILFSAIGLAIALGAFVFSNIVSDLATTAFGSGK